MPCMYGMCMRLGLSCTRLEPREGKTSAFSGEAHPKHTTTTNSSTPTNDERGAVTSRRQVHETSCCASASALSDTCRASASVCICSSGGRQEWRCVRPRRK
ncbi:unnamed protein product [Ectocarpus sp. 13 AM-2016]